MSNLTNVLKERKNQGRKVLASFITAGDPDFQTSYELVRALEEAGSDVIELGVAYCDPLADGPILQQASQRALAAGSTVEAVLALVERVRLHSAVPLVLLVYYNSILQYGAKRFLKEAALSGVDALIVPDLPLEERGALLEGCRQYALALIPLVAPTSKERAEKIVKETEGFVYAISSLGVTGKRTALFAGLPVFAQQLRSFTSLPVLVGFGISTPSMAVKASAGFDGVIVGSALVEAIRAGAAQGDAVRAAGDFIGSIRQALDESTQEEGCV